MLSVLIWIIFGFIVGAIAKAIHPGSDPLGCISTIAIGVFGSIVGGIINWLISAGSESYEPSGFIMSILGGVVCCIAFRSYLLKTSASGPRNFFTGKLEE